MIQSRMKFCVVIFLQCLISLSGFAENKKINVSISLSSKGNDIAFDQAAIQVPFGATVSIKFRNQAAPDSAIQHNIAILKPGTQDQFIKDLQASGYDIEKIRKHPSILAMTRALDPGEEESLIFNASNEGFYPYLCMMAGHGDMLSMRGVIHVAKNKK